MGLRPIGLLRRRVYEGKDADLPAIGELSEGCAYDEQGYYKKGIHNAVCSLLESRTRLHEFDDIPYTRKPADAGPNAHAEPGCAVPDCRRIALKDDMLCARCNAVTEEPQSVQPSIVWKAVIDPASGKTYYYNTETQATQWEAPPEFAASEA